MKRIDIQVNGGSVLLFNNITNIEEFLKINEVKKARLHDIESYKLKIAESKQIIKDLKEQYRSLYIEFEKLKKKLRVIFLKNC